MSTTYVLRNILSDLSGGADFNLLLRQNTTGAVSQTVSVNSGAIEDSYGFTAAGDPSNLGTAGVVTIKVNVTTGSTRINISVECSRINNSGVVQASSGFTAEQTASAGVKTFISSSAGLGTWNPGDRLRVTYRFRNTFTMLATCVIELNTANATVVADWTMPIVGDDSILTDVCGNDIAFIHKWSDVCSQICGVQLNSVDETALTLSFYGLTKFEKGYNNNNKVFYTYQPLGPGVSVCECWTDSSTGQVIGGGPCGKVNFGVMDTNACTATQVKTLFIPWTQNFYWAHFFGVDRNDVMHYLCDYGCPPAGSAFVAGQSYRRYIKVDSTGVVLLDTMVLIEASSVAVNDCCDCEGFDVNFDCQPGGPGIPITCIGSYFTHGPCWLTDDGSRIIGLGSHASAEKVCGENPGGGFFCGCSQERDAVIWAIDTSGGTFSILGPNPAPVVPDPPEFLNTSILGNQICRYPDASVVVFGFVDITNTRISCNHYADNGTYIQSFNLSGGDLGPAIAALTGSGAGGRVGSVSAAVDSAGATVWLRFMYNSDSPFSLNGRSQLFRTTYPLHAGSVFTFVCDLYAHSQTLCNWGQLQLNTGQRNLTGGMYTQIDDVATVQPTLFEEEEPPEEGRLPITVTLVGAT